MRVIMGTSYNPPRKKNLYTPTAAKLFKISRSKLDLFLNCPRCFYLDRRLGVGQPPGYPFNLNTAVDTLLKKEFDFYRQQQKPHPFLIANKVDAIPFMHPHLAEWRNSLHGGIQFQIANTNIIVTGSVDDIWIDNKTQELIIVDYKATSKTEPISLKSIWQLGYKRQVEIYQWLFRQNGFKVSDTAYFVYCNGRTNLERFAQKLEFDVALLAYKGKTNWVAKAIQDAYACLCLDTIPPYSEACDYCKYLLAVAKTIPITK